MVYQMELMQKKEKERIMDEKKKPAVYLVDSENVNDIWVMLAMVLPQDDEILIFYTNKSPHVSYERVVELTQISSSSLQWIKCVEGSNALDFQLVTELGARVATTKDKRFVIISNDTGFDAAVTYWQQRGEDVCRMKTTDCKRLARELSDLYASMQDPDEEEAQEMRERLDDIEQLSAAIQLSDQSLFHDAFVCMFTQRRADDLYYYMKEHREQFEYLAVNYIPKRKIRQKRYFQVAMKNAGYDVADADAVMDIYQGMEDPKKSMRKISEELVKMFGRDIGLDYYKLLRKNVRLICKL